MAGHSSGMFVWSWTEGSVLGSQVFGQAFMESCAGVSHSCESILDFHPIVKYFKIQTLHPKN